MKYIIQVYEGEINGHGEKVGLTIEYHYEFEQEMLKHVKDLKNNLKEEGWREKNSPEVSQISFLRNELNRKQTSGEGYGPIPIFFAKLSLNFNSNLLR